MNPSKQTISLHPRSTTCPDSSKAWSTVVAIGEPTLPGSQNPVVFQLPLEPTYFYIATGKPDPPHPANRPPPIPRPTALSPPPPPHSSDSSVSSSSSSSPGPPLRQPPSNFVIASPEVKANRKPVKKVHFALPEHNRSPSPEIAPKEPRTVRLSKDHQNSKIRLPEQALTHPLPDTRSKIARPFPGFRCGSLRLLRLKSRRRPDIPASFPPAPACHPAQPTTMAPPPLSPYELEPPAEYLPPPRAGHYAPLGTGEMYGYVLASRGASVPTRRYSYPIPILRSPSTSQSRSAQGDVEEEIKITHTTDSPVIAASHHLSRHGHAYEVHHFCSVCRSPRSRKYHKLHPVEPGKRIEPGVCRKCKTSKTSSDEEERVVINRPGRNPLVEMGREMPVVGEERGRRRHKPHDRPRFDSGSRVAMNILEMEGHRGGSGGRTGSDSRVRITIEDTVPSHQRRSRSRTVVRMQEWDERASHRLFSSSEDIPARTPMTVRHMSDAEKKLRSHPQAFRHGFFTRSKSRTRAPSPPSAQMSRLSVDQPPLPNTRAEAFQQASRSKHGSQTTRTHTSWVTYPASSPPETQRARTYDTRSTSVLRSGSRRRPDISPRRHMQARQMSRRAEDLDYEDELRVRFTPGPRDEQARRRRGYDGHFSDEAERMSGYYWYDAPRHLPTAPRQVIPSSEPTDHSAYAYHRQGREPIALTVHPRAPMSMGPTRAPEPPSTAYLGASASRTTRPSSRAPSTRLWTQESANVGSSYAGSRSSYHLVDVRDVDSADSKGYPTTIREIEDTRYSRGG